MEILGIVMTKIIQVVSLGLSEIHKDKIVVHRQVLLNNSVRDCPY